MAEEGFEWYFGYGSNMNTTQLTVGKGVVPLESCPARLEGWRLCFNMKTVLKAMGSMANVMPDPNSTVHGTLHKLTKAQLAQVDEFEGVGRVYMRVKAPVKKYTGETVESNVYTACPGFLADESKPSLRYKTILLTGARDGNIEKAYCDYLEALVHYPFEHNKDRPKVVIPDKTYTREEVKNDNGLIGFMGVVFDISTLDGLMKGLMQRFGPPEFAFLRFMPSSLNQKPEPHPDDFADMSPTQLEFLDSMLHAMELEWPIVGRCPLPTKKGGV